MRDTDTEDEYPRESRKRLTSCTDERNILWYFEFVNPFWYFFSVFLITYTMVRYIIAFRPLTNINCFNRFKFVVACIYATFNTIRKYWRLWRIF